MVTESISVVAWGVQVRCVGSFQRGLRKLCTMAAKFLVLIVGTASQVSILVTPHQSVHFKLEQLIWQLYLK